MHVGFGARLRCGTQLSPSGVVQYGGYILKQCTRTIWSYAQRATRMLQYVAVPLLCHNRGGNNQRLAIASAFAAQRASVTLNSTLQIPTWLRLGRGRWQLSGRNLFATTRSDPDM